MTVLTGTSGNDRLTGTSADETLQGLEGNDTLEGRGGFDLLIGGEGNDDLYFTGSGSISDGGPGDDYWAGSIRFATVPIRFSLAEARSPTGTALGDGTIVRNIERFWLETGSGDDLLLMDAPIIGQSVWFGGAGFNRLVIDQRTSANSMLLLHDWPQAGSTNLSTGGALFTAINIGALEVFGSLANDQLVGGNGDDFLSGGPGNDQILGGNGRDTMLGGAGNDVISDDDGFNLMDGGPGNDVLVGRSGDTLLGGDGADQLIIDGTRSLIDGGAGVDQFALNLRIASPISFAIAAARTTIGITLPDGTIVRNVETFEINTGPADDTVIVDAFLQGVNLWNINSGNSVRTDVGGDQLTADLSGAATDVQVLGSTNATQVIVANGRLDTGTLGIIAASGGSGNDLLRGIAGNDWLFGRDGNDTLMGMAGNDTLIGGGGNDMLDGGAGFDRARYFGNRTDFTITRSGATLTITDTRGQEGTDTLTSIEQLEFTDGVLGSAPEHLILFRPADRGLFAWNSTLGAAGFTWFFTVGTGAQAIAADDFTGDGQIDVLFRQANGDLTVWSAALAGNGFENLNIPAGFAPIAYGDLRGSTAVDIVLQGPDGQLLIADPAAAEITALFNMTTGWRILSVVNINSTGKNDVIMQNDNSGAVIAFTESGWVDLFTLSSGWDIVAFGDVIAGPEDEFLLMNNNRTVIFWDPTKGGSGWQDFATLAAGWTLLAVSDLSGDARDDIILQNTSGAAIYWTSSGWVDLGATLMGNELIGTGVLL